MWHKSKVRTLPEAHGTNQITDNVGPKFWNGINSCTKPVWPSEFKVMHPEKKKNIK